MAQRTAFASTSEDGNGEEWNEDSEGGRAGAGGGMRMSQMIGPFGTAISHHAYSSTNSSPHRPSMGGESSGSQNLTPGDSAHASSGQGSFVYGGGTMPGPSPGGRYGYGAYGRLSEEAEGTEYQGAGGRIGGSLGTAHSSQEDLLGGQEPSFFSVVLNPRRTLRVVNND